MILIMIGGKGVRLWCKKDSNNAECVIGSLSGRMLSTALARATAKRGEHD